MSYFDRLEEEVSSFFTGDWVSRESLDKDFDRGALNTFAGNLLDLKERLFTLLNYLILVGEFATDDNLLEKLKLLSERIKVEMLGTGFNDDQMEHYVRIVYLDQQFIQPMTAALKKVQQLCHGFQRRIEFTDNRNLIIINEHDDKDKSLDEKVFEINVRVAHADINLLLEEWSIYTLYQMKQSLIQARIYSGLFIYSLIEEKLNFLIVKLLKRKALEEQEITHIITSKSDIKAKDVEGELKITKSWLQKISEHYSPNSGKRFVWDEIKHGKDKLNVDEIHELVKFYKDNVKQIENNPFTVELRAEIIMELYEVLRNKLKNLGSEQPKFSRYSLIVAAEYVLNNWFSVICENKSASVDELKMGYLKVMRFQEAYGLKNFFSLYKYFDSLKWRMEQIRKDSQELSKVEEYSRMAEYASEAFGSYYEYIDWTRRNYNYVFQLPFEECSIKLKDLSGEDSPDRLFIFSSFVVPLRQDQYIEKFEESKRAINVMLASRDILVNVNSKMNELDKALGKAKDKEIQTLTTLSIFTAIIAFVTSSVGFFHEDFSVTQMSVLLISYGLSLLAFVFGVVHLFRQAENKKDTITNNWIALVVLALLLWFYFISQ